MKISAVNWSQITKQTKQEVYESDLLHSVIYSNDVV